MIRKTVSALLTLCVCATIIHAQPPINLAGYAYILDPGHSLNENVGIYNYSEARKVLRVGFHLRDFLLSSGPDTVVMTRTDSLTSVSIAQRYTLANNLAHPNKWFHSIHSDAATMGSSANSILILISDNCWVSSPGKICQSRWGQTTITMGDYQSDLMARTYRIGTRGTYGDRTFGFQFGTSYGTSGVGVLRETQMPATLSEGGFHTNPRQNLLNMNEESKRSEAKSIWMSLLAHAGVTRPPVRTLMGVISDLESNAPLKSATAITGVQSYTTNTHLNTFAPYCGVDTSCSNGYYYFENLPAGLQSVTFSAPGYYDSTLQVSVSDTFFSFLDVKLLSKVPPRVVSSTPANGAIGIHINAVIRVDFSRSLDRFSSQQHIRLVGPLGNTLPGVYAWSNSDRTLQFTPDSLFLNDTPYKFVIGGQVKDLFGNLFDGDGNGIGGDSLAIVFRTRPIDTSAPVLVYAYPAANDTVKTPNPVISLTFDEILDSNSVSLTNFAVGQIGGPNLLPRTVQHWISNERSGVNVYLTDGYIPGATYRVRVTNVSDRWGNVSTAAPLWTFSIAPDAYTYTTIDGLDLSVSNWLPPTSSGSTIGVDSATFSISSSVFMPTIPSNPGSAELKYYWREAATSWLLREYLSTGPPRSVLWRKQNTIMQVYLFGDGGNSQFRFAIDDSVDAFPAGRTENHEVSTWKSINWIGWRLMEWDLERDSVGTWIGNGNLEGELRFDSFQLRFLPGTSMPAGRINFDQLQIAKRVPSSIRQESGIVPRSFALHQNYPNPFNPETRIVYEVSTGENITVTVLDLLGRRVRTLVSEPQQPGTYSVVWNGRDDSGTSVSSGMYFYKLQSETVVITKKMTLLK